MPENLHAINNMCIEQIAINRKQIFKVDQGEQMRGMIIGFYWSVIDPAWRRQVIEIHFSSTDLGIFSSTDLGISVWSYRSRQSRDTAWPNP